MEDKSKDPGPDRGYWFPAKRYGWGWGLPIRWQGWEVLVAYLVLTFTGLRLLRPPRYPGAVQVYVGFLTAVLVAICWIKGEPPKWRWGGKD